MGTFALFAAEQNSFQPDEMRLLLEMAGDLSFTLDHIHKLDQELFSTFSQPFRVDDTAIHITLQVGVSLFPSDAVDVDTLYKYAEIALKRAQSKGEPYLLYDPAMNERIIHSVTLEAKLRKAIEQGKLLVYYQPKVSTTKERVLERICK